MEKKYDKGQIITFGSYYQNSETKKESIEWQVLDVKDNNALLISKYALDCKRYNRVLKSIAWETCTLRKWLNKEFLNHAFSKEEQDKIVTANVSADENPKFSTNPGNDTEDKVFLLSIKEAQKYFDSNEDGKCVPTEYAIAQGAYTNSNYTEDGKVTCWWLLRSPGYLQNYAAFVNRYGSIYFYGGAVNVGLTGVRPALWVNL